MKAQKKRETRELGRMDKNRAIELLKEALSEVSHLRELRYGNQDLELWRDKVSDIIEAAFGRKSSEYDRFARSVTSWLYTGSEIQYQNEYSQNLDEYETALKSIIQKQEILGIKERPASETFVTEGKPKAFIAHGGDSPALSKLKQFLEALDVQPLVVEEQASEDRSVGENVDWYSKQADCAIILATKGDIDGKTGASFPEETY